MFCLIKSIDNKGCFSSYHLIRRSIISDIEVDTNYLDLINNYIKISKDIKIYDVLFLDTIDHEILCDKNTVKLLDYILQQEYEEKKVVSLCLKDDDDVYFGYIDSITESSIYLNLIDSLALKRYEQIEVLKSDIDTLQVKGIELHLLDLIYK